MLLAIAVAAPAWAETLIVQRLVRPNSVIAPGDVTPSSVEVPGALGSVGEAVGLEARVTLYPGRPVLASHVGPAALIERNQPVTVVYRQGGLTITAEARALSRGAMGDTVRVMNLASRNTVSGRVLEDGRVEVLSMGYSG